MHRVRHWERGRHVDGDEQRRRDVDFEQPDFCFAGGIYMFWQSCWNVFRISTLAGSDDLQCDVELNQTAPDLCDVSIHAQLPGHHD